MMTTHAQDWSYSWRQEGRQEGAAHLLERQLVRKFGTLSDAVRQRLQQANNEQLEAWSLNLLDAATLEAVFGHSEA